MKNKLTTNVLIIAVLSIVTVLELLVLKYFGIVNTLDKKDIIIFILLLSGSSKLLSWSMQQHASVKRGYFTRNEKQRLAFGAFVIATIITAFLVMVVYIGK